MKEWKVFGHENQYRVSDQSDLETRVNRNGKGISSEWRPKTIRFRRMDRWGGGYYVAELQTETGKKTFTIHRLVVTHFIGEIHRGLQVNHIDGNRANNTLQNLEICTPKGNMKNAIDRGAFKTSRRALHRDMDEFKVLTAITLMNAGYRNVDLSKVFGIAVSSFSMLRNKKQTWKRFHHLVGGIA